MAQRVNVGVAGLGVMGQRMLGRILQHPRLQVARIWDANPDTLGLCHALHPDLPVAHGPEDLVGTAGLHALYVATPPAGHLPLCNAGFDAGLAVLCEPPLALDFDAARRTVHRIADHDLRAAVTFPLATSLGLASALESFAPLGARPLGDLRDVSLTLDFAAWPRPWQTAAGQWLARRGEGGFSREVLAHYLFVLQRVLGPATVWESAVRYPTQGQGAETKVLAQLSAAEVPVQVAGQVDPGVGVDERIAMVWRGTAGAIVLRDWYGLERLQRGGEVQSGGAAQSLGAAAQALQLDQWVDLVEGRPHSLAGFAEALAVMETVEDLLRGR